ncbi:MAG: hypothetical protein R3E57_07305 [Porticoccaceae bacterium]
MKKDITNPADMRKELNAILDKDKKRVEKASRKSFFAPKPECVAINFRCARNGRGFAVTFEKEDKKQPFVLTSITKTSDLDQYATQHNGGRTKAKNIDISTLPMQSWHCPWCKDEGLDIRNFVHCGACNEYVCYGRTSTMPNGKPYHRCTDICGTGGEITGTLSSLKAGQGKSKSSAKSSGSPSSTKGLLPKTSFLSLPKK